MKKIKYTILQALIMLSVATQMSCGTQTPQFDGDYIFIVDWIQYNRYQDSTSIYTARDYAGFSLFKIKPCIVAQTGKFQIGDTIKLCK